MKPLVMLVYTANILASFSDPFEFDGDYGPEMNPTRHRVFELVVPRESLAQHLSDEQLRQLMLDHSSSKENLSQFKAEVVERAIADDRLHGPTLGELCDDQLIQDLVAIQKELSAFPEKDLQALLDFVERFKDKHVFRFLNNTPKGFLSLDKTLSEENSQGGRDFGLPLLRSAQPIEGCSTYEMKRQLMEAVFVPEVLELTRASYRLRLALYRYDVARLKDLLGEEAEASDLRVFCSPSGQTFLYWLYHSLNLHILSEQEGLIEEVNYVKDLFASTIGNPVTRAEAFRDQMVTSGAGVLFTQESDELTRQTLVEGGYFLSVADQNPLDGCFVFLRSDFWEPEVEQILIEDYEGFEQGRLNVVLAKQYSGEFFVLASAHGNSTNAADGRLQIALIKEAFDKIQEERNLADLQLLIGIDANTKSEADVEALHKHLDELGLQGTQVGPTTIKKRMVTVQHSKVGKLSVDEEDYLITLKPESGGHYLLENPRVGFGNQALDTGGMLPNRSNLSDHYPVGGEWVRL